MNVILWRVWSCMYGFDTLPLLHQCLQDSYLYRFTTLLLLHECLQDSYLYRFSTLPCSTSASRIPTCTDLAPCPAPPVPPGFLPAQIQHPALLHQCLQIPTCTDSAPCPAPPVPPGFLPVQIQHPALLHQCLQDSYLHRFSTLPFSTSASRIPTCTDPAPCSSFTSASTIPTCTGN